MHLLTRVYGMSIQQEQCTMILHAECLREFLNCWDTYLSKNPLPVKQLMTFCPSSTRYIYAPLNLNPVYDQIGNRNKAIIM